MQEAYQQGQRIFHSLTGQGILSLALTDWIWLLGAVVLLILAIKVVGKLFKAALFVAAVVLIIFFLMSIFR